MAPIPQSSVENRLLASLPKADFARLAPKLQWVDLKVRDSLYRPNQKIGYAYFPTTGICSVIAENAAGVRSESGVIGNEGFIGNAIVLFANSGPSRVIVQAEGRALRIKKNDFRKAMTGSPILLATLLRFIHVFMVQISQTAITNGHNTIAERLARWMLMYQDRADAPEFTITHEFLALMLAVRRSGVTEALNDLEGRNMIRATRGRITILDRSGLLAIAGGAYGVPEKEYKRLISAR
jgi:CRP-like cAMP-binding protein